MKEAALTEQLLREFLLGQVNDEERQQIESLFLTDQLARERVLAAEEGLIDDYLDGSLTKEEREQFLERYAETPAQQQKLKLARSIKDWAGKENASPGTGATTSVSRGWRERLPLRPVYLLPVAAAVVIATIVSVVWLNSRIEQRNRHVTIHEEVVKLNRSGSPEVAPQSSLELKPLSFRTGETEPELVISPATLIAELRFLWLRPKTGYTQYRAIVRRAGRKELVTTDLAAEADGSPSRLLLPSHLLTRGEYHVELGGLNADGTVGPTEEYRFTVRGL